MFSIGPNSINGIRYEHIKGLNHGTSVNYAVNANKFLQLNPNRIKLIRSD